jgi:hypothetical protein
LRKFHCEVASAEFAPELLTKQRFYIGFVVDHEYDKGHLAAPAFATGSRGSTTLNSVKSSGRVSTAIEPACNG